MSGNSIIHRSKWNPFCTIVIRVTPKWKIFGVPASQLLIQLTSKLASKPTQTAIRSPSQAASQPANKQTNQQERKPASQLPRQQTSKQVREPTKVKWSNRDRCNDKTSRSRAPPARFLITGSTIPRWIQCAWSISNIQRYCWHSWRHEKKPWIIHSCTLE